MPSAPDCRLTEEEMMTKHIKPRDNEANQTNANKGTSGTNLQYDQAQGNRGKLLDAEKRRKEEEMVDAQIAYLRQHGLGGGNGRSNPDEPDEGDVYGSVGSD